MSEHCPSATRKAGERAARALDQLPDCAGVDLLDPAEGVRDEWTIEATFTRATLPPAAVQVLADQDCAVVSATLRAPDVYHLLAAV